MLNRPISSSNMVSRHEYDESHEDFGETSIDLDRLLGAVRRQYRIIAAGCLIGIALGVAYILTAQPLYTASTQLLMDNRQVRAVEDVSALTDGIFDTAKVDSQVELLKSEKISLAIIEKLDLINDTVFMDASGSLIGRAVGAARSLLDVTQWFADAPGLTDDEKQERTRAAVETLSDNLQVSRVGRTYVLSISYTSPDANQAARISNTVAEAYLTDLLDSKYDATRRASTWLQARIQELKEQSLASDLAVQKFRADNNLVATDGKLIGEQQLTEVSSQLIIARAATGEARARYERIRDIIDTGQLDAAVTEALTNPVIADLRSKFLEASKRYAEISQKLGVNHIQAIKFKNEMAEYQRVIFDELGRIAQSYQSDYEIAKAREQALNSGMNALVGEHESTNRVLVTLRELERESETYKNLYQTFLQRYQEAIQQQSFPITEARVITRASRPERPSHPKKTLVLALALILGGMGGTAIGALREYKDRGVRTGDQVRDRLGFEFLGLLPMVEHRPVRPPKKVEAVANGPRVLAPTDTIMRQVLDSPLSGFAETLRSAKIAADLMLPDSRSKIIGMVSCFPGEGKSTVSKNFATLLANLGARTLLIDCDLRNPGLTRSVAGNADAGVLEVLLDDKPYQSLLLVEPESKLFILPAVVKQRVSHTAELLASPAMKRLLKAAGDTFDYIIIDLPPMAPVVDVRAMANQIDAFLFIVEWGKTPRHSIRSVLGNDERIRDKCLGVVLNKVDTKLQKMYENYHSEGYQYSSYSRYYSQ